MKFSLHLGFTAFFANVGLVACAGSSSGIIGPQGDAYVVHHSYASVEAKHQLYRTDGTNTGTLLLHTPATPNPDYSAEIDGIVTFGDFVYFTETQRNESTPGSVPSRSFYQLDTNSGVVVQQPFLANNQITGTIRSLIFNNILFVYRTTVNTGPQLPMDLELIAYTSAGVPVDLSTTFASFDMFFGEAVAIDTKLFFLSKAGFVSFDMTTGAATEVSLPSPYRSVFLGHEDGKLFVTASASGNDAKLYAFDPTAPNAVPVAVSSTYFGNLDGEKTASAGGYILGSDGVNLIAHNASTGVETTLLPCINIKLLRGSADKAHIACAQTSSGYIDLASIGLTGGTPTAQMVSSGPQGRIMDRARNYGVKDRKIYYNGHDTAGHKVWEWDLVLETIAPVIHNNDSFSNAIGFTEYNDELIFSAHKTSQPAMGQLFQLEPVTLTLDILQ